MIYQSNLF